MKTDHLTDDIIQAYILQEPNDPQIALHISECTACKAKMESYMVLMDAIRHIEPETFSFDAVTLVLQKIEAREKFYPGKYPLTIFSGIFISGVFLISLFIIKPAFQTFRPLNEIENIFIAISAVCVFTFLLIDIFRQFRQKEMLLSQ